MSSLLQLEAMFPDLGMHYLAFDTSEDSSGLTTFDASAAVVEEQLRELIGEVLTVFTWAAQITHAIRGPLDEGADWDCALQASPGLLALLPDPVRAVATECCSEIDQQGREWHSLNLTFSGTQAFAEAFRERFDL